MKYGSKAAVPKNLTEEIAVCLIGPQEWPYRSNCSSSKYSGLWQVLAAVQALARQRLDPQMAERVAAFLPAYYGHLATSDLAALRKLLVTAEPKGAKVP